MSQLMELCELIYLKEGKEGVTKFITENYPNLPWWYCDCCDDNSPCQDKVCLICGTFLINEDYEL